MRDSCQIEHHAEPTAPLHPRTDEAIAFLKWLRPGGPWGLTAIVPEPNGRTTTQTFTSESEAAAATFIRRHNATQNIYYALNATRGALLKKASKTDVNAIEYLFADLDPAKDETPDAAKKRFFAALAAHGIEPSGLIDSGNGLQSLFRLTSRVKLGKPIPVIGTDGKSEPKFSPEDRVKIDDAEVRTKALTLALGGTAGTQNIDRILRLPGTVNWPNDAKRRKGRVPCMATTIKINGAARPLESFPRDAPTADKTDTAVAHNRRREPVDSEDELLRTIYDGGGGRHGSSRSEAVWFAINEMLRRGHAPATIAPVLLDRGNRISDHVYEQSSPQKYVDRQVAEAVQKIQLAANDKGAPYESPTNVRIALLKLGVALRHDRFSDRTLIDGLADFGPVLDDAAVSRIWLLIDRRFHFRPAKDLLFTIIADNARLNGFHPVQDYLDALKWDGEPRIDRWLTTYGGAEDTPYVRAVGALLLTAAVRRVRQPGCKFDEMIVLETPQQGTDKSSSLAALAARNEWFSDDLPLNADGKRVIEALRGRWLIEAAELSGMRRTDVEHLKAFLSRTVDRARMSYDRLVTEVPRQCVIVGTTNSEEYLVDASGNRRFWPVLIGRFNLALLKRDRDQLWAEAAEREASGASIRLDPQLWAAAAEEQARRLTVDPYLEELQAALADHAGKIASSSLWEILDIKPGHRTQDQNRRLGEAMRKLGWTRANSANTVKIGGKNVSGFVRGEQPWATIAVVRTSEHGLNVRAYDEHDVV